MWEPTHANGKAFKNKGRPVAICIMRALQKVKSSVK